MQHMHTLSRPFISAALLLASAGAQAQVSQYDIPTFIDTSGQHIGASGIGATLNPNATGQSTTTGNAPIVWGPMLSDSHFVAMMLMPPVGSVTSGGLGTAGYFVGYHCKLGNQNSTSTYIPAGTKGNPSCYEGTISTAQAQTDSSVWDAHVYGGTVLANNGFAMQGIDLNLQYSMVTPTQGTVKVFNGSIDNYVSNPNTVGAFLQCNDHVGGGVGNCTDAFEIYGNWTHGLDSHGHDIANATSVSFAQSSTADPLSTTDYAIVGSATDTLRIRGGGTAGGMNVFGAVNGTNAKGAFRFQNDTTDDGTVATVDFTSGSFSTNGYLDLKAMTAPAAASGHVRIYVDAADNKLKAIGGSGTVTVLASP
jgi:hypothetical protein